MNHWQTRGQEQTLFYNTNMWWYCCLYNPSARVVQRTAAKCSHTFNRIKKKKKTWDRVQIPPRFPADLSLVKLGATIKLETTTAIIITITIKKKYGGLAIFFDGLAFGQVFVLFDCYAGKKKKNTIWFMLKTNAFRCTAVTCHTFTQRAWYISKSGGDYTTPRSLLVQQLDNAGLIRAPLQNKPVYILSNADEGQS